MLYRPTPSSAARLLRNILIRDPAFERTRVWLEYRVGRRYIDIYLADYGVGIEVDGPHHKQYNTIKTRYKITNPSDEAKTRAVEESGIALMRITVAALNEAKSNPQTLIESVRAFIKYRGKGKY